MSEFQVYLLAGGNGKRAGGPKAWLDYQGSTLLQKQISFLSSRFDPENITVTIQKGWRERCEKLNPRVIWVPEDPKDPPMAALIAALQANPLRRWAFLYHVDMPLWDPKLFDLLEKAAAKAQREGLEALVPAQGGRKGHPVLLSPSLCDAILALDPQKDRLDVFLRGRREGAVEVPFGCIFDNWNERREPAH